MGKYDDIINHEYKGSPSRGRMSLENRATQFAPFAALTGHDAAINETARLTTEKIELYKDERRMLSERILMVLERIDDGPQVTFTVFRADQRKSGGRYVKITGTVKKYDESDRTITMTDGQAFTLDDVEAIEGDVFNY